LSYLLREMTSRLYFSDYVFFEWWSVKPFYRLGTW
jgi:hypothetical protein